MIASNPISPHRQVRDLLRVLSQEQILALLPLISDLIEACRTEGTFEAWDRDEFRSLLDLCRLLPDPILMPLSGVVLAGSQVGLEQQLHAGGYGRVSSDITSERFRLTLPPGPRDIVLACFGVKASVTEVKYWAKRNGYGLGLIDDILAIASHPEYRNLYLQFPIDAIGSPVIIHDRSNTLVLRNDFDERKALCVDNWGSFDERHYFILIPKPKRKKRKK